MKKYNLRLALSRENVIELKSVNRSNFARYKESPFREKAIIIIKGIRRIRDWSFSINNFLMAGSNSQAIAEVLPATKIEKKPDKRILSRYFLE